MKRMNRVIAGCVGTVLVAGCATRVAMTSTRREDVRAQSITLASTARDLAGNVRSRTLDPAQEPAREAIVKFNDAAVQFSTTAARWSDEDTVGLRYEELIRAWVQVKRTFSTLPADRLLTDAYQRVTAQWIKLQHSSGNAGVRYERSLDSKQ